MTARSCPARRRGCPNIAPRTWLLSRASAVSATSTASTSSSAAKRRSVFSPNWCTGAARLGPRCRRRCTSSCRASDPRRWSAPFAPRSTSATLGRRSSPGSSAAAAPPLACRRCPMDSPSIPRTIDHRRVAQAACIWPMPGALAATGGTGRGRAVVAPRLSGRRGRRGNRPPPETGCAAPCATPPFPFLKTSTISTSRLQSALRPALLGTYLGPDFVTEGRNLILMGKTGSGKTHLAIAIAYRAIQNGFDGAVHHRRRPDR